MNDDDRHRAQALVHKLLNETKSKAAAGNYREALTAAKKAKALDQANVFLLALERQVEQIQELAITGILSDTQKTDILESIPKLVDQATQAESTLRGAPGDRADRAETEEEREARIAAGRWLKNQYFQRAHEFVRKAEYDQALAELRKIFAIDDHDKVAREFELKILQMLELSRHQSSMVRPEIIEQSRAPKPSAGVGFSGGSARQTELQKKRTVIWIAVIVTVAVAILATIYFMGRQHTKAAGPVIDEAGQEKTEEVPMYPVPPPQIPSDTTRHDTALVR
jgi:hypothetical protein